jgi:hypothetical protein
MAASTSITQARCPPFHFSLSLTQSRRAPGSSQQFWVTYKKCDPHNYTPVRVSVHAACSSRTMLPSAMQTSAKLWCHRLPEGTWSKRVVKCMGQVLRPPPDTGTAHLSNCPAKVRTVCKPLVTPSSNFLHCSLRLAPPIDSDPAASLATPAPPQYLLFSVKGPMCLIRHLATVCMQWRYSSIHSWHRY